VELRGLEPLTSSMPSTVDLCGGPALSLGDWSRASALDRDFARGSVSSLVISVVVKLTFSLRTLLLPEKCSPASVRTLQEMHRDRGGDGRRHTGAHAALPP
jgi:hypothetical protein